MTSVAPITKIEAPSRWGVMLQYGYLQGIDLLSTLAFLLSGVEEANPLVRASIRVAGDPLRGLLMVKGLALGLGLFCLWRGRVHLLRRINVFFAVLIAWNMINLIGGLVAKLH